MGGGYCLEFGPFHYRIQYVGNTCPTRHPYVVDIPKKKGYPPIGILTNF